MPLPPSNLNTAWPPPELARIAGALETWSAWYSGDPAELERVYWRQRRLHDVRPSDRPSTYRGGIVGAVARTFWGAPRRDLAQAKAKLHVPLAGDICQASADLLFSEPPTITFDDGEETSPTRDRLDELVDDGMLSTLAEAAELAAALGGTFLRVTWDKQIRPDAPFFTAVDADAALPEFRWGKLTAVTFWTVTRRTDTEVWRHLERHELDSDGTGVILHGLYQGTRDNLGRLVPLTEDAATRKLADDVVDGNRVSTESPGLAVTYIPNQRPQRRWRGDPIGCHLGRSDLDGVEGLMDALDETYTSWMRDIRLGKARVFVFESMLENLGVGSGTAFDTDQEIFSPLNGLVSREDKGGMPIQAEQFAIRYAEHDATARGLIENILRTAGYSTQTFGMDSGVAGDTTATEIVARQQRSYMTRDRKVRLWRPNLADAVEKLLAVDKAIFATQIEPARPTVQFPDGVQDSMLALAQTAQALSTARAASIDTVVQMVHPDWTPQQIKDEVAKIMREQGLGQPAPGDPTQFGLDSQQP